MEAVFIEIEPFDRTSGGRLTVTIADGPSGEIYGLGAIDWQPAVTKRPEFSIELFDPDLSGKVSPGKVDFALALDQITNVENPHLLYWKGAPVRIYTCPDLSWPNRVVEFVGKIVGGDPDKVGMALPVRAEVDTKLIDKPLLTDEFTGGAGADGEPALRGTLKPAGFGYVENVPPVWFDTTDNIGMLDGYGNVLSIDKLFEGASDMGAAVADYPTYDALRAAIVAKTVPPGRWATCVAEGMVGLGAPPAGVIGCNVHFGADRPGAMMKRVLLTHAGAPAGRVLVSAFDALDAAVNRQTGFWTDSQRNCDDLLAAIAASCNATMLVDFQGRVIVTRAVTSAPVATLDYSGSVDPRVTDFNTEEVQPPYYELKARTARPGIVLTTDQVRYEDDLKDRGLYNPATTYRAGDLVWLSNKAQYLYQNATPSAGHAPPDPEVEDAWWYQRQPGIGVADIPGLNGVLSAKSRVWFQPTPPSIAESSSSDYWIDTGDQNKAYRRQDFPALTFGTGEEVIVFGTEELEFVAPEWVPTDDLRIGDALSTAYARVRLFRVEADPSLDTDNLPLIDGDIWVKPSSGALASWDIAAMAWKLGSDVTSQNQLIVTIPDKTVLASSTGVPTTEQFPVVFVPIVTRGGVDVRTDATVTYSLANVSSSLAAAISVNTVAGSTEKGHVSLNGPPQYVGPGTFDFLTLVDGVERDRKKVTVRQDIALPDTGGGTGGGTGTNFSVDLTGKWVGPSYAYLVGFVNKAVASGQTVYLTTTGVFRFIKSGSGGGVPTYIEWKGQYSVAGANSWTDMPAGLLTTSEPSEYDPASGTGSSAVGIFGDSVSGLAPGNYDFRLWAHHTSFSGNCIFDSGNGELTIS